MSRILHSRGRRLEDTGKDGRRSNYHYYIGDERLPPPQITVARKRESGPAILVVTGKSDFLVRRTRRKGGSTRNYLEH
ncbi:hypothetical protein NDU88_007444 [Pleurodeles waltl]|uniref:Uncharacterized protein n=1 Tax=Pleurodeles waltl TaxID=8319 RepID=A0AAV7U194_PLEWA|nr:hypothetical protein NDU88_007444 [Pleurodeles waltl]